MGLIAAAVIAFEVLIFLALIAIVIYLIFKRLDDKKTESFEQGDN